MDRYTKAPKNSVSVVLFFVLLFLSSCKKEELPVTAHDPGNVITSTVNMEASYKWQFYFDLKTNTVVGQNLKTSWDLGFETSAGGFHVVLNGSKAMFVRNTMNTDFLAITDTNGFIQNKKWDESSGNMDSTAIGDWRNTNNVYIVDRGYSESGVHQGFRKIQFQNVNALEYEVRFAELNGQGDSTLTILKDSTYNLAFLSFSGNNVLMVEPPKVLWDLTFTQYTHVFYEETGITPYLVTGCLLNRYLTKAVMDSSIAFSQMTLSSAIDYILIDEINTIGYNWKVFVNGTYVTFSKMNYVIKDAEGYYYKFHFIDFYNNLGVKGNPKWEYQQL
ncbi:MAG: HmuY family protein [Bacteroidota bacterium]